LLWIKRKNIRCEKIYRHMPNRQSFPNNEKSLNRIVSLDVFRGLTIAGMILVTDPGTYAHVYPQLLHAGWMGATAADMIFPSFLFIVGVSVPLSFTSRIQHGANRTSLAGHIFRRAAILFILGLLVNGFPGYQWHSLRLPGILQRIAICYASCGLIYLYTDFSAFNNIQSEISKRRLILPAIAFCLLACYWAMLVLVPVPGIGAGHLDTYGNLPAYIDRAVMGINHMWVWGLTPGVGITYDPEGILSTLPAIASTLIGVIAGEWMQTKNTENRKVVLLIITGVILVVMALLLSHFLPINKRIWTSTYALLSSGIALILFAVLYFIVDLRRVRWWIWPALVLGTNAILAFIISSLITSLGDLIHVSQTGGQPLTLHEFGYKISAASGLSPTNASLLYAIVIVLINIAIITPLYYKKIYLKV